MSTQIVKEGLTVKQMIDDLEKIIHDGRRKPITKVMSLKYYLSKIRSYKFD